MNDSPFTRIPQPIWKFKTTRVGDADAVVVDLAPDMTPKYKASVQRRNWLWLFRLAAIYRTHAGVAPRP
jgi:hypothetical protein